MMCKLNLSEEQKIVCASVPVTTLGTPRIGDHRRSHKDTIDMSEDSQVERAGREVDSESILNAADQSTSGMRYGKENVSE